MILFIKKGWLLFLVATFCFFSCKEAGEAPQMTLISGDFNGTTFSQLSGKQPLEVTINLSFSNEVDPSLLESNVSISPSNELKSVNYIYQTAGTKAVITLSLNPATQYSFTLAAVVLGKNNEKLNEPISFDFETIENDEIITSTSPCLTTSSDCIGNKMFSDGSGNSMSFSYYRNYPLYPDNARWEEIENAVIVVHGANRNANDYFSWMTGTLQNTNLQSSTILISPNFKVETEAASEEYFWDGNNWRDGAKSTSNAKISSFSIIDSVLSQLSNTEVFPNLKKIIITGHSSGGLFTHVYGAANKAESNINNIEITYVVANSQYFYYPDGQRVNQGSQTLFTPTSCNGYETWPLGYNLVPEYVSSVGKNELDNQFQNRRIFYLLGNGSGSDGAFNNSSCAYQLLGESRYLRGENMFTYMGLKFNNHAHERYIVEGVGHNGQGMYTSAEYSNLLTGLLTIN